MTSDVKTLVGMGITEAFHGMLTVRNVKHTIRQIPCSAVLSASTLCMRNVLVCARFLVYGLGACVYPTMCALHAHSFKRDRRDNYLMSSTPITFRRRPP